MAGTTLPPGSFKKKFDAVIVLVLRNSLKVAVTGEPTLMPAEPAAGALAVIVGGVVSGVTLVNMSFWISAGLRARL